MPSSNWQGFQVYNNVQKTNIFLKDTLVFLKNLFQLFLSQNTNFSQNLWRILYFDFDLTIQCQIHKD